MNVERREVENWREIIAGSHALRKRLDVKDHKGFLNILSVLAAQFEDKYSSKYFAFKRHQTWISDIVVTQWSVT